jgi:cell division protein FtsL
MPFHIDIIGVTILLMLIVSTQIIVVIRTVQTIKYHARSLTKGREEAIQSGE